MLPATRPRSIPQNATTRQSGLPTLESMERELPPWIGALLWRIVLTVLLTAGALWAAWQLRSLLLALVVSLFLSFAFEPAVAALARRGWPRARATGVVLASAVVVILGVVLIVLPPFVHQVATLLERATDLLDEYGTSFDILGYRVSIDTVTDSLGSISDLIGKYASTVAQQLAGIVGAVGSLVIRVFTVLLFTFFLLSDGPRMRRRLFAAFPEERQREVARMWEMAIDKTGGYVASRLQLALISAVVHSALFAVAGLPSPVAYGLWVGSISQFIPAVGGYIAAIIPLLAALAVEPSLSLWVLVILLGYQQVENYWLAPRITARRMSLHPAIGFGAAVAGILLMGALGAFLALPVAAIGQALVSSYLGQHPVGSTIKGDDAPAGLPAGPPEEPA